MPPPPPCPLCLDEEVADNEEDNEDNDAVDNDDGDEDMPPKAKPNAAAAATAVKKKPPAAKKDDSDEVATMPSRAPAKKNFSIDATDRFLVAYYGKGVNDYADVAIMVNGTIKKDSYEVQVAEDGLSLSWRRASRSECFNKEILKKILGDEYRDSSHRVVAWDDLRMEMREKNVHSKQGLFWGAPMVVHLKWKCTGTPIVSVKDYPTSYRVKDKFGEVHTQCNCIVLITVKKAEERFREAVEEERGFVDLFGSSSQSQMSGYSPPSPPPRRKKMRRSNDRRRSEESRHRVDDDNSGGDDNDGGSDHGEGKRRAKDGDNDCGGDHGGRKREAKN